MIRNHGQHASQVRLGVDAVQFRGAQQAVERGRTLTTLIRPQKQEIFSSNGHASKRALGRIMPRSGLCRLDLASRHSCSTYTDRLAA